jgi:hypothetical protein
MLDRSLFRLSVLFLVLGGGGCSVDMRGLGATPFDAGQTGAAGGTGPGSGGAAGGTGGAGGGTGGATAGGAGGQIVGGNGGTMGAGGGGQAGAGGSAGAGGAGGASPPCGPSTCDGCCTAEGACVKGHNDQACGTAGAACVACDACHQCSSATGVCDPNPSAHWDVVCVSALVTPTKPGNVSWDPVMPGVSPAPDPFCQFTINGVWAARTTTILNTTAPVWNQGITPPNVDVTESYLVGQAGTWAVAVLDDDLNQVTTEPICAVIPHLTAADFAAGTVTFPPMQSCTSLTIQLVCAE